MATERTNLPAVITGQPPHLGILIAAMSGMLVMILLGPMMVYTENPLAGEGNPLRQAAYLVLILLIGYGARPMGAPKRLLAVPMAMVVALAWCWLSVFWSLNPGVTLRRLALTTAIIWAIFVGVRQLGYTKVTMILRVALTVTLVANFVTVFLFPDIGIHQSNTIGEKDLLGDWRGIMMHKNFAGAVSALLIPFYVFDAKAIPKWLRAAVIAGAVVMLWFSQSKTSIGLIGFGIVAGYVFQVTKPRQRALLIPALILLGMVGMVLVSIYNNPLNDVLRDPTAFTGRMKIWYMLVHYSSDHPLLGAGYGAFWNIGPNSPVYQYEHGWVTDLTSGHNGLLDILVQVGWPGLVLILFATVIWPLYRIMSSSTIIGERAGIVIAIILFAICHNGTESSLFERDMIMQAFLIFAIALIAPIENEAARKALRKSNVSLRSLDHLLARP